MSRDKVDLIAFHLLKAENAFKDAKILADTEGWNGCANRLYYACFYVVEALLLKHFDITSQSHSGLKTKFNQHYIKTGIIDIQHSKHYTYIFELRGDADYGDFSILTKEEVEPLVGETANFIHALKQNL